MIHHSIEPLESRIAPATLTLVNATTATYTDADGDLVTVKFSKAILNEDNLASVLVTSAIDATHDQLQTINLTVPGLAKPAGGTAITISVQPQPPGDGFANVGYIKATGLDLGAVTIRGDLGAIDAGDATTKTAALKSLTVQSLGVKGLDTGAPDLHSDLVGALKKLVVKGNVSAATIEVSGGADGKVGAVTIGGSLEGGGGMLSGAIHSTGDMGAVKIGYDLRGGSNNGAGAILSDGKIASVTIGHDLFGGGVFGAGLPAGVIHSGGDLGKISIGGELIGGIGDSSGSILSDGKMGDVFIGGSLRGGIVKIGVNGTPRNGYIGSVGDIGKVTIKADMVGTFLPYAASIVSGGKIAAVNVGGSVLGGEDQSGLISAAGDISVVTIGGSVHGGDGVSSGSIVSNGNIKTVKIGGALLGGTGNQTGIISGKNLGTITVTGVVAAANSSGAFSFSDSGAILAENIKTLSIGGLSGGSAGAETLARVGYISATGSIKSLSIIGDVVGGSLNSTGSVTDSGAIRADHIDKIVIGGSISAGSKGGSGTLTRSGAINVVHDIGSLTIRGNIEGGIDIGNNILPVVISAAGKAKPSAKSDVAIGSITIGGSVTYGNILAGYSPSLTPVNGGAQIGKVTVGGNWTGSNLIAGAMNATSGNKNFGNDNDASIAGGSDEAIAKIASISIGGIIDGRAGGSEHFGFVAHQIGSFAIGGIKIPLEASPFTLDLGATADVSIHKI